MALLPLQITIRDIPETEAIEAKLREKAEKLNKFYSHIISCRVVVEVPQKHQHQGKLFAVKIDVSVPGKEIVVNRVMDPDLYVAIRDAFKAAQRQLEDHAHIERGDVKHHPVKMTGRIVRLLDFYGFITANDTEYYFQNTNVNNPSFEELKIGMLVEFFPEVAKEGWQAYNVSVIRE